MNDRFNTNAGGRFGYGGGRKLPAENLIDLLTAYGVDQDDKRMDLDEQGAMYRSTLNANRPFNQNMLMNQYGGGEEPTNMYGQQQRGRMRRGRRG